MCHAFLIDTSFYQLLTRIDESLAEEVRARGCGCGGRLHSALLISPVTTATGSLRVSADPQKM